VLNTPLRQLTDLFSTLRAIVVGVRREGTLFAPEPGDQLFAGDQIYYLRPGRGYEPHAGDLRQEVKKQERVVIVGGGNVGLAVARRWRRAPTGFAPR
jgi:trk system potassium uptake protein TrkA